MDATPMKAPSMNTPAGSLPALRRTFHVAACALLLSAAVLAGDNDPVGVLPATGTGDESQSAGEASLGLSAVIADDQLDPGLGSIHVSVPFGPLHVNVDVPAESAVFVGLGDEPVNLVVSKPQDPPSADLQGPGQLAAPSNLDEMLVAAPLALARVAVVVVDDGTATLEQLLSGQALPQMVLGLGDVTVLDLALLRAKVAQHAKALGSHRVSVVMVSLDLTGEVRFAAARVGATDEPTEIAIH